jgi:hypothetical protein
MNRSSFVSAVVATALLACGVAFAAKPAAPLSADRVFHAWDADGDGNLSSAEFRLGFDALQQVLAAEQRLREQYRIVDTDRSGTLEAGEYAALVLVKRAGAKAPPFATFDASGDARLDFSEYVRLVQALAPRPEAG